FGFFGIAPQSSTDLSCNVAQSQQRGASWMYRQRTTADGPSWPGNPRREQSIRPQRPRSWRVGTLVSRWLNRGGGGDPWSGESCGRRGGQATGRLVGLGVAAATPTAGQGNRYQFVRGRVWAARPLSSRAGGSWLPSATSRCRSSPASGAT